MHHRHFVDCVLRSQTFDRSRHRLQRVTGSGRPEVSDHWRRPHIAKVADRRIDERETVRCRRRLGQGVLVVELATSHCASRHVHTGQRGRCLWPAGRP